MKTAACHRSIAHRSQALGEIAAHSRTPFLRLIRCSGLAEADFGGPQAQIIRESHGLCLAMLSGIPDECLQWPCTLATIGPTQLVRRMTIDTGMIVLLYNLKPHGKGPRLRLEAELSRCGLSCAPHSR